MAVTASVQLPDQPASGATIDKALGGPGLISPHSCHDVSIASTSDASGGTNTVHITTDPRWSSIFAWAVVQISGAAADVPYRFDILSTAGINGPSSQGDATFSVFMTSRMWVPPPILATSDQLTTDVAIPFRLRLRVPNTDGEVVTVTTRVYNFRKHVEQVAPLTQIYSVLSRSTSDS